MTTETIYPEPEPDVYPEPEPPNEPEPEPQEPDATVSTTHASLMQVLPADFPLPALIRFVPDARLRQAADTAAAEALAIAVTGAEGLVAADAKCGEVRTALKAIEEHFAEPTKIANDLHKSLTGTRGEWLAAGATAVVEVGRRIRSERQRLDAIAAEGRRKAQEEADCVAREEASKQAEAAEKANAPAPIVENLKKQAETAQAPPVSTFFGLGAPKLANTSVVKNWTATIKGTPRDAEQQPCMADLTDAQWDTVRRAMQGVIQGVEQRQIFEINWSYINKRAKADESTFNLTAFEAYDAGGTRGKGGRRK